MNKIYIVTETKDPNIKGNDHAVIIMQRNSQTLGLSLRNRSPFEMSVDLEEQVRAHIGPFWIIEEHKPVHSDLSAEVLKYMELYEKRTELHNETLALDIERKLIFEK
jgi:hypothetical protein